MIHILGNCIPSMLIFLLSQTAPNWQFYVILIIEIYILRKFHYHYNKSSPNYMTIVYIIEYNDCFEYIVYSSWICWKNGWNPNYIDIDPGVSFFHKNCHDKKNTHIQTNN